MRASMPGRANQPQRRLVLLAAVIAALVIGAQGGCADQGPAGKVHVHGLVTWNGAPIEKGYVTFQPEDGKSADAGAIQNGRYSFYAHPGNYRVAIRAEKVSGFNQGMNQPNIVQYIPSKYNVQSELSAKVVADGDNSFDFSLTDEESGGGNTPPDASAK